MFSDNSSVVLGFHHLSCTGLPCCSCAAGVDNHAESWLTAVCVTSQAQLMYVTPPKTFPSARAALGGHLSSMLLVHVKDRL